MDSIAIKVKQIREQAIKKMQAGGQYNFNTFTPDPNPSLDVNLGTPNLGQYLNLMDNESTATNMGIFTSPEQLGRMQNNQYANNFLGNYDENGNAINTNGTNIQTQTNRSLYNPYSGVNLESALFSLGQSLNYSGDNKSANTLRGIGSAGKVLFGGARTLFSGAGYQNRNDDSYNDYRNKLYNAEQTYQYLQEGGLTNAAVLTGGYIPDSGTGSVEIENGEHVKNGQTGEIAEAVGETHEKGGIKTDLPDQSKVLSDHTKIGAANAKLFRNDLDIKVKASDTFAAVLDRYNKKIGWTDILEEEEKTIEKVGEQETEGIEETTKDINTTFLAEKLQRLQQDKEMVRPLQDEAFEKIFEKQEKIPKKGESAKMQEGGQYDENILALSKQYKLSPEKVVELLKASNPQSDPIAEALAQGIPPEQILQQLVESGTPQAEAEQAIQAALQTQQPQMQQGGVVSNPYYTQNPYALPEYGNQDFGATNYLAGNVSDLTTANQRIQSMTSLYPYLLQRSGLTAQNNTPNLTGADSVLNFQNGYNAYADAYTVGIDATPNLSPEQKQQLKDRVANERFLSSDSGIRGTDGILGNYTSARGTFSLPVLTQEDRAKYPNLKFIGDAVDENGNIKPQYSDLDPSTTTFITDTYKNSGVNSLDIGLLDIPQAQTQIQASQEPQNTNRVVNELSFANLPVDFNLPPTAMQDVFKASASLSRIDPTKISIEPNLIEADRQRQAATESIAFLPDSQRAAVLASLLGQTQNTTNQAITQAEQFNAQAQNQADIYNAQQSDKQQLLDNQFAQDYEQKALAAQNNTERDLRQYFNQLNDQQWFNYNYVDRRRAINEALPNFQLTGNNLEFQDSRGNILTNPLGSNILSQNYASLSPENKKVYAKEAAKRMAQKDVKNK